MKNTAITNKDFQEEKEIEYNFPEHGVTVKAASLEEAKAKLKQLISQ